MPHIAAPTAATGRTNGAAATAAAVAADATALAAAPEVTAVTAVPTAGIWEAARVPAPAAKV